MLFNPGSIISPTHPARRRDVRSLKNALSLATDSRPSPGTDSGMTDEVMFDAVRRFQRDNGLRVDGEVRPGGSTQRMLNDRLADITRSSTQTRSSGANRTFLPQGSANTNANAATPANQSGGGFLQRLLDNATFAFGETRTASSSEPSFRNLAGPPDDGSRPLPPDEGDAPPEGETPPDGDGGDNPDDGGEEEEEDCPKELLDRVAFLERHKAEVSQQLDEYIDRHRELSQIIDDLQSELAIGAVFGMLDFAGRGIPSLIRRFFRGIVKGRISGDPEGEANSPSMAQIQKELEEAREEQRVLQEIVIPEAMERLRRVNADLQDAIDDAKAAGCYGSNDSSSPNGPTS